MGTRCNHPSTPAMISAAEARLGITFPKEPVSERTTHGHVVFLVFGTGDDGMVSIESPLLSTGEVAGLLGVSRQHVVDL